MVGKEEERNISSRCMSYGCASKICVSLQRQHVADTQVVKIPKRCRSLWNTVVETRTSVCLSVSLSVCLGLCANVSARATEILDSLMI